MPPTYRHSVNLRCPRIRIAALWTQDHADEGYDDGITAGIWEPRNGGHRRNVPLKRELIERSSLSDLPMSLRIAATESVIILLRKKQSN